MANENRGKSRSRTRSLAVRKKFFLEGSLYKVLSINRAQDIVIVWDFTNKKRKSFVWTDIRKRRERAFTISEVSEYLTRHRVTIERDILAGRIRTPQRAQEPGSSKPGRYYFSEKDVFEYHDYISKIVPGTGLGLLHKNMISK